MSEIAQLLISANFEVREKGTNVGAGFVNICCPYCGEDKFHCGINEMDLWFKCFVCGEGGSWAKIRKLLKKLSPKTDWGSITQGLQSFYYEPNKAEVTLPDKPIYWREVIESDESVLNWLATVPSMQHLKDKDRERGLSVNTALDAGLMMGVGKLAGYIVFKNGGNVNARKFDLNFAGPRWWKQLADSPYIFGKEWVEKAEPAIGIITEGIFDCLRVPLGFGVAILGSAVSELLVAEIVRIFNKTKTLVLALDKDANRKSVIQMRLMLADVGFEVIVPDWDTIKLKGVKDLDELFLAKGEEFLFEFLQAPSLAQEHCLI